LRLKRKRPLARRMQVAGGGGGIRARGTPPCSIPSPPVAACVQAANLEVGVVGFHAHGLALRPCGDLPSQPRGTISGFTAYVEVCPTTVFRWGRSSALTGLPPSSLNHINSPFFLQNTAPAHCWAGAVHCKQLVIACNGLGFDVSICTVCFF